MIGKGGWRCNRWVIQVARPRSATEELFGSVGILGIESGSIEGNFYGWRMK